jgi:ubiquinone/menaquinone biosynthesis C-methylase UbiE
MHHIVYPSMAHYYEAVTEHRAAGLSEFPGDEDTLYGRLTHRPELERVFHAFMESRTRVTSGQFAASIRFSRMNRLLDVGGGNGETVIQIARRHPNVRATVLDLPSVVEMAEARFREEGLADRLDAVASDILKDPFPSGYDCIMFCHLTPIWSQETNRSLMCKAYEALGPGGFACIYAPFMNDDQAGPLFSALASPYFLCTVNGQGRHYSWNESIAWLREAGFVDIRTQALFWGEGIVLGARP